MNSAVWTFADILQKLMAVSPSGRRRLGANELQAKPHVMCRGYRSKVKAQLVKHDDRHYLLATCQAKNVGLSIIRCRRPNREERALEEARLSSECS